MRAPPRVSGATRRPEAAEPGPPVPHWYYFIAQFSSARVHAVRYETKRCKLNMPRMCAHGVSATDISIFSREQHAVGTLAPPIRPTPACEPRGTTCHEARDQARCAVLQPDHTHAGASLVLNSRAQGCPHAWGAGFARGGGFQAAGAPVISPRHADATAQSDAVPASWADRQPNAVTFPRPAMAGACHRVPVVVAGTSHQGLTSPRYASMTEPLACTCGAALLTSPLSQNC